ncbi:MAG: cyclic nucleotide-binding domain-containing protein [Deltaproteobacteria bacterium]|nr:cyclic nucleotide-binding domain-containing protein [Deltaproteobacteria bacterium]
MNELARTLRARGALAGLEEPFAERLAAHTTRVHLVSGEFLFREGESATSMWILTSGRISLEVDSPGGPIVIETLTEGDVLGWSSLFPPRRWHLEARAMGAAGALRIDGPAMSREMEADPVLGYALTKRLLFHVHERLMRARLVGLDMYGRRE